MSRADDYLAIPTGYCEWLGGLRWCASGEAVEYACDDPEIGITFAMVGEISLFVQGFSATCELISFGGILHLLHLLGLGTRNPRPESRGRALRLESLFRELSYPYRNAGALSGSLCGEFPPVPAAPQIGDLSRALLRPYNDPNGPRCRPQFGAAPPFAPADFEERFLRALDAVSQEALQHWLKFGRAPVGEAGEQVTRAIPQSLSARLATLVNRPRLAGAGALVAHLAGALALPPRRLAPAELAMGGYADVATRGLPEQILPAQLALERDEFVRRFVQRELLYFRREEPTGRATEEMVLVLDQGVRTWGEIRLVLCAAVVALARQADRKGLPLLLATTGRDKPLLEAAAASVGDLGEWLEASDLTPHPAEALQRVLAAESGRLRDVIVLTHARNLHERDFNVAARNAKPGLRLFGVGVDAEGGVAFSELQRGEPIVRSRCRIDLAQTRSRPAFSAPEPSAHARNWSGDNEALGWPFKLGALGPIPAHLVDFDESGEWVLFTGMRGLLHAWRVDGTRSEMLPRGVVDGQPLQTIDAVVGVAGGFVVGGRSGRFGALVHYDLGRMRCTVRTFLAESITTLELGYNPTYHSVVVYRWSAPIWAVDLDDAPVRPNGRPPSMAEPLCGRAARAFLEYDDWEYRPTVLIGTASSSVVAAAPLRLDSTTGMLSVRDASGAWSGSVPLRDGRPGLRAAELQSVCKRGDMVGAVIAQGAASSLYLVSLKTQRLVETWPLRAPNVGFALSRDGLMFARRVGDRHIEVRRIAGGPSALLFTPKAKFHPGMTVGLGEGFLTIRAERTVHVVRWDSHRIEFARAAAEDPSLAETILAGLDFTTVIPAKREGSDLCDVPRVVASCHGYGLAVAIDFIGQVAVLDDSSALICMFRVFRQRIAAWMPDGTRLGPESMTGAPPTPGGDAQMAQRLRAAARQNPRSAAR